MSDFPIVEKLGGRETVFAKLRARGDKRTTVGALRMWARRGSMPGDAMRRLMEIAEAAGIAYTAADFRPPDEPGGGSVRPALREAVGAYRGRAAARSTTMEGRDVVEVAADDGAALRVRLADGETLAALRRRARDAGRTLEAEIGAILTAAARAEREALARWAAALRDSLRGAYRGDATADIRADRQR
jgi:plasmid stability protein